MYNEQEWKELNETHTKEEIKTIISSKIEGTPMPMREISRDDALESFDKMLNSDSNIENSEWYTRYEYDSKWFLIDKVFKCDNTGNKASDYFQQYNRWLCDSVNSPSPYRSWTIERFRLTLLNALWGLKVKKVDDATFRTCISLRKYIASQFRPSTAKSVYDYFKAKDVLDLSSGWGDRLAGFYASDANSYVGVDPNEIVYKKYFEQIEMYENRVNKKVELFNCCAEDMEYDKTFDLVFTSPPYFNIERYTQEDNQSFKKWKKLDDWLENFLFASLEKAWKALRVGGHMVINISDVYSGHKINKICDPMNEFIETLDGSEYVGCMGYEMRKRPRSKAVGKGRFGEPIWVWKKTV